MALQKTAVYTNIQKASSIIADIVTTDDSKVGLIEIMARKQAIPWESALVDETMTQFQKNMSNICEIAVKNNVPVVVCTVASNVEGLSPMGSEDTESEAFKAMKAKGLNFLANDNFEGAKSMADSLMHDFPDNAWGYFLQGKLENNTASGAGCDNLKKARDLDGLRFRAPGRLNSIIREMPNVFDGQVVMVDVEPVFDQHTLQGCPGYDLFVDHVHPTAFGHHLIARAIAKRMAEARLVPDSADTKDPGHDWIDWEICREIAGYTYVEEMMTLMQVFTLYRRYPLQTLPEASEQIEKTGLEIKNIFNRMSPVMQMTYERWVKENYTFDLHYEAGKIYFEKGDCALAQKEFQIALKAHPDNPSITELLAKATACLAESGGSGQ